MIMKLQKCKNGHFFDRDRYEECPHCEKLANEMQNTVVRENKLAENEPIMRDEPPIRKRSLQNEPEPARKPIIRDEPAVVTNPAAQKASTAAEKTVVRKEPAAIEKTAVRKAPEAIEKTAVRKAPEAIEKTAVRKAPEAIEKTAVRKEPAAKIPVVQEKPVAAKEPKIPEDRTVGYYSRVIGTEPVVGWLVCIEGEYFGESFKLKSGKNFIGRSSAMDIVLSADMSVSRSKHAIVIYEPRKRMFIAQEGDSRELFYLNDSVVLSNEEMHAYDVLLIGTTKLMLIPCCGDQFSWDDLKKG
jgi:hypothetical protein